MVAVDIYIVDSGVNVDHKEFQGRARWGFVAPGYGRQDKLGHGTHGKFEAILRERS